MKSKIMEELEAESRKFRVQGVDFHREAVKTEELKKLARYNWILNHVHLIEGCNWETKEQWTWGEGYPDGLSEAIDKQIALTAKAKALPIP